MLKIMKNEKKFWIIFPYTYTNSDSETKKEKKNTIWDINKDDTDILLESIIFTIPGAKQTKLTISMKNINDFAIVKLN